MFHSFTTKVSPDSEMLVAEVSEKNKKPIFDTLAKYLPPAGKSGLVLEIASGTGQHICDFASHFPDIVWQPSDLDATFFPSISAHIEDKKLSNVRQPLKADITEPVKQWVSQELANGACDLMLNVNMVHISPWEASVGLFRTAGTLLKPGGLLFMYGPYKINGVLSPESNVNFDQFLRSKDSSWGVRDVIDLDQLATENGLKRKDMVDMPSNNKCLIYEKTS